MRKHGEDRCGGQGRKESRGQTERQEEEEPAQGYPSKGGGKPGECAVPEANTVLQRVSAFNNSVKCC